MFRCVTYFGTGFILIIAASVNLATAQSFTNDSGGSLTFYGQLSPAYLSFDDGEKTNGNVVDNTNSNTRVGFNIDQLSGDNKLRFKFETALGAPASSSFSQDFEPDWEWDKTKLRKIEMIYSAEFGAISFGQGSMASDGIAHSDLSKTKIVAYVYRPDVAGGYRFREGSGDLSDVTIKKVFKDFDGGRKARIRYDTPSFHGLTFAAAYGVEVLKSDDDADYYDLAMLYTGEAGDLKMEGALGYAWEDNKGEMSKSYAGSFSAVHVQTGLNGTVVAGADPDDGNYIYGKLGWIGNFLSAGYTAFSADYYNGSDFMTDGSDSDSWGVQAVQKIENINLEAYLAYTAYSYDDDTSNYQDASSILAGIHWKF